MNAEIDLPSPVHNQRRRIALPTIQQRELHASGRKRNRLWLAVRADAIIRLAQSRHKVEDLQDGRVIAVVLDELVKRLAADQIFDKVLRRARLIHTKQPGLKA